MAIKYQCRSCGKRYMDWGAEKLGFKCPDCENEELVPAGQAEEKVARRPALKRKPRRAAAASHLGESELIVQDIEEIEAEEVEFEHEEAESTVFLAAEDEGIHEALDIEDVVPPDGLAEADTSDLALVGDDLPFTDATPPLGGVEDIDETVVESDEWSG
jgi:hypothetical protein